MSIKKCKYLNRTQLDKSQGIKTLLQKTNVFLFWVSNKFIFKTNSNNKKLSIFFKMKWLK